MRSTKPSLRSSLYNLLAGQAAMATGALMEERTEDIRQAMVASLGEAGTKHFPMIARRINGAGNADSLWYLRSGLMAALCAVHGERTARIEIMRLSAMFRGMLPEGQSSRPSPLSR